MPKDLIFCSDLHGNFSYLRNVIDGFSDCRIIQLGDLGIGFAGYPWPESWSSHFSFIRGNHDSPEICRKHPNYLGDYGYIEDAGLFYLSGASSIDREIRTAGVNWWDGEQLSFLELKDVIRLYAEKRPKILITHTAPQAFFKKLGVTRPLPDRTSDAIQVMLDAWRPAVYIFAHFHYSTSFVHKKMKVVALDTEQLYRLNPETLKGERVML